MEWDSRNPVMCNIYENGVGLQPCMLPYVDNPGEWYGIHLYIYG